jgi:hypothetical protein
VATGDFYPENKAARTSSCKLTLSGVETENNKVKCYLTREPSMPSAWYQFQSKKSDIIIININIITRRFKYDRDDLCVNKSQFVPVIFEPPCINIILLAFTTHLRVLASSVLRFRDHKQGRITVGRTPLDEWSARRRDYLTNTQHSQQTNIHAPGRIRNRNPSKRSAADPRLRPLGHWDRQEKWHKLTVLKYWTYRWFTQTLH